MRFLGVLALATQALACGKGLDAYSSVSVNVKDGKLTVDVSPPGPRCPTLSSKARATANGKPMERIDRGGDHSCNFNAAAINCSGATFELPMPSVNVSAPIRIELADGSRTVVVELSSLPRENMVEVVSPCGLTGLPSNSEVQIRVRFGVGRWSQVEEHPRFGKKDAKGMDDSTLVHFERKSDTERSCASRTFSETPRW